MAPKISHKDRGLRRILSVVIAIVVAAVVIVLMTTVGTNRVAVIELNPAQEQSKAALRKVDTSFVAVNDRFGDAMPVTSEQQAVGGQANTINVDEAERRLPEGRYADRLPQLKEAVSKGDHEAALLISRILLDCKRMFDNNENRLRPPAFARNDFSDNEKDLLRRLQESTGRDDIRRLQQCEGLGADEISGYMSWLELAADAGVKAAQSDYGLFAFSDMSKQDMIRSPEKIIATKERLDRWQKEEIRSGSVGAMLTRAYALHQGYLQPKDDVQAYAYYYAVVLARPQLADPSTLNMYGASLNPEQLTRAQREGVLLSRLIKKDG